jgi:predicted  nucleic acid-binding Zn-ribbon protein
MEPNYSKIFNKETLGSVESFCKLNNIDDVDSFIKNVFQEGFNIKKYGLLGNTVNKGEKDLKTGIVGEKQVEIEVIREIRVEVPVEKIVERIVNVTDDTKINELLLKIQQLENRPLEIVEVVKEVPIDRVVEKIIYTTDDNQINELGEKNAKLEIELFENSEQLDELLSKIEHLNGEISIKTAEIDNIRQEFSIKTKEMENIFQNKMSKKDKELDELKHNLDIPVTNNRTEMLQETIVNLNTEIRNLKKQIKELEKKILEQPKNNSFINAKFHGSSNLNV